MMQTIRIQFDIEADDESALYDRIMDLTYDLRYEKDVSNYIEEVVDSD